MTRYFLPKCAHLICLVFIMDFLVGCTIRTNDKQAHLDDAQAFCAIHGIEHWRDAKGLPVEKLNELVVSRELGAVKTQEFKELVLRLGKLDFYRELYPTAKQEIETITGTNWDCAAYEQFTKLIVTYENETPLPSAKLAPDILVRFSGDYLLNGEALDLDSNQLQEFVAARGVNTPIVIRLGHGTNDDMLLPLFQYLSKLNVENVSVIED